MEGGDMRCGDAALVAAVVVVVGLAAVVVGSVVAFAWATGCS